VPETLITGAQARGNEVAVALEKVATAVADAAARMAELNSALARERQPAEIASSYVDFEPGLAFADWRCEVLSLL
jgi:hypothetical protein